MYSVDSIDAKNTSELTPKVFQPQGRRHQHAAESDGSRAYSCRAGDDRSALLRVRRHRVERRGVRERRLWIGHPPSLGGPPRDARAHIDGGLCQQALLSDGLARGLVGLGVRAGGQLRGVSVEGGASRQEVGSWVRLGSRGSEGRSDIWSELGAWRALVLPVRILRRGRSRRSRAGPG